MDFQDFLIFSASNNKTILDSTLMKSPDVCNGNVELRVVDGVVNAGFTYNSALKDCSADYVVLVHQDVYIPYGWINKVRGIICDIEKVDKQWGVLGVAGVDVFGNLAGHLWSSGINGYINTGIKEPVLCSSLDEVLLVVNVKTLLQFDEKLPGFHLFGTDIVQQHISLGGNSYVIDAPVVHDDEPKSRLGSGYLEAYRYIAKKWRGNLPINTCCVEVTKYGIPFYVRELKQLRLEVLGRVLDKPKIDFEKVSKAF